jgi:hypothetical protein
MEDDDDDDDNDDDVAETGAAQFVTAALAAKHLDESGPAALAVLRERDARKTLKVELLDKTTAHEKALQSLMPPFNVDTLLDEASAWDGMADV